MKSSSSGSWRQQVTTASEFLQKFHPEKAKVFFMGENIQRSLAGNAPTLADIVESFEIKALSDWMCVQLTYLSQYLGYATLPNQIQAQEVAQQFHQKFHNLRVTEVMYYFECIKDGRYYDSVNKLEPTKLIKGVYEYLGYLNALKEKWGSMEEFNDDSLRKMCKQMMLEGHDLKQYPREAMATLLGWYLPVTRQTFKAIEQKLYDMDDSWVEQIGELYTQKRNKFAPCAHQIVKAV
jgi:hypothetical protein